MTVLPKWDGHVHGPFCQHGNPDPQRVYVEKAITQGFAGLTFTEHPPLPARYLANHDQQAQLAMKEAKWSHYLNESWRTKRRFAGKLEVHVGAELDYLAEAEDYTLALLDECIELLEEVILSVHYLPGRDGIRCVDWSADDLQDGLISYYGSYEKFVDAYYEQVERAVEWAMQLPVPVRLGHLTLYRKFQQVLPEAADLDDRLLIGATLKACERYFVGIDVNAEGRDLATCGDWYFPAWAIEEAEKRKIPLVYGSDAHHPDKVGRYYHELARQAAIR